MGMNKGWAGIAAVMVAGLLIGLPVLGQVQSTIFFMDQAFGQVETTYPIGGDGPGVPRGT